MSIKRVINITLIAVSLLVSGCFDSNKSLTSDKGKGVELVRNENSVTVNAKEEFSGASFVISQEIDNSNIVTEVDKLKLTKKADGKTYIQIVDMDEPLKEGEKIFEIKNCREKIEVKMEESITERSFEKELSKLQSRTVKKGVRAGTTDELLGDFNSDSKVDIQDFVLFQSGYGTNSTVYDIAPAVKGSATPYTDVYSKRTPDGVVDLFDFLIFAKNYGKNIVNLPTVIEVVLSGTATVEVDSNISIYAKVKYSNNTEKSEVVNWSSSNEAVAVLTANGEWATVTGKGAGTAVIKAEKDGKIGEFNVTVTPKGTVALNSIVVEGERSVAPGTTITLTAKGLFADGTQNSITPVWSSSNSAVATVDSTGKVTGVSGGTVKIYAEKNGIKTEKTVLVKAAIDGIVIHCKSTYVPYIWAWATSGTANYTTAKVWPGDAMTLEAGTTDWYKYTISSTTLGTALDSNIIFSNKGASQTATMTKAKGEWWYNAGSWSDVDPNTDIDAPVIAATPAAGKVEATTLNVTLTATDNKDSAAKIYYTKDGTIPTTSSTVYNGGISLTQSSTIKAIAVDASGNVSRIYVFSYELGVDLTPPVVTATPAAGRYETAQNVTLNVTDNKDSGLNIYYTLDGSEPKAELIYLYNGQTITVNKNIVINVLAQDKAGNQFKKSFRYYIGPNLMTRKDFREESIYFVMTARFYDGDSSNNRYTRADDKSGNRANNDPPWRGDFKGLIEKLDYIKAMGFTAVWITPVVLNRSDYDFHGYHGWDFERVDPRLESPGATFQDLIDAAHAKGIKIIQDIVLNHTSRYGAKQFGTVRYWGDSNDPQWGDGTAIDYYDVENPNFEYDGLSVEPISGKSWYNGDLWQKEKPNLPWTTLPKGWGSLTQYKSPEGYNIYNYQWPDLDLFPKPTYHGTWLKNWEDYTCQLGTIHEDCIDLNTENSFTQQKLIEIYQRYIDMGVDAFRIDTVKHISRVMFNRHFIPAFKERGGENFFMFGEVATRVNEIWNKGNAPLSTPFYTWKERTTYSANDEEAALEGYNYEWAQGPDKQPQSNNHLLDGNNYRTPDYSKYSGMSVIDFPMHWNFKTAGGAFGTALGGDKYYNDATWNVVYVQSHDYSPWEAPKDRSYRAPVEESVWAEDTTLMWTFRGIPCLFYGDEIQFKKGMEIDIGPTGPLENTGRAYFGNHITGSVNVSDFGVYSGATGNMAATLAHPLAKHIQRLNMIRHKIPALQKGQYSTEGVSGGMAFKRRFTDSAKGVDSFVLVTISGGATFSGIPNGTYKDAVTGDVKVVSNGTLTADCSGQGNARIYVLDLPGNPAPGKIGETGAYLK